MPNSSRCFQLSQHINHDTGLSASRPQSSQDTTLVRYDCASDRLRNDYGDPCVRAMYTYEEALGEDHTGKMLEPECVKSFLILVLRIHYAYRFRAGDCPRRGILEAADEAVD